MKNEIVLGVEELEERIAPDGIGGTPGTGTSNSNGHGTETSRVRETLSSRPRVVPQLTKGGEAKMEDREQILLNVRRTGRAECAECHVRLAHG
jgi:hypothetical protein